MNIPRIHTISVPHTQPQPPMEMPSVKTTVTSSARKVEMSPVRATIDPALRTRNFSTIQVNSALRIAKTTRLTTKPTALLMVN